MSSLGLLITITVVLVLLGIAEHSRHLRHLAKIKTRIHVNGTRGKSSVTRLIAAGLRAGGLRTCAKTTGTLARMILPNGQEYPIFRPAGANVIEQLRIVRTAVQFEAEVLVIECMAVQPPYQSISELKMVRATHGVITNARADHLDAMGPTEEDVALALAATTPLSGKLYTTEPRHLPILAMAAQDRSTQLLAVTAEDIAAISTEDLSGFRYLEHAENVALALRVCADLGVARSTALAGMWSAQPDPGVLTAVTLDFFGRRIIFVNAFAANDPESTGRIWKDSETRFPDVKTRIALVNCRADRPDRSQQLGQACISWGLADHYVLIGSGTYIFAKAAINEGLDPGRITYAEDRRVEEVFETLVDQVDKSAVIIGMANIGGMGLDVVRFFKNRSIEYSTGNQPS